jgi:hypothetical protein
VFEIGDQSGLLGLPAEKRAREVARGRIVGQNEGARKLNCLGAVFAAIPNSGTLSLRPITSAIVLNGMLSRATP